MPRTVGPRAAPQNTNMAAASSPPHASVRRRSNVVFVPTVLDPLPHVPVNIVQSEAGRRERTHRNRPLTATALAAETMNQVPVVVRILRRNRQAEVKRRVRHADSPGLRVSNRDRGRAGSKGGGLLGLTVLPALGLAVEGASHADEPRSRGDAAGALVSGAGRQVPRPASGRPDSARREEPPARGPGRWLVASGARSGPLPPSARRR